jgi:hypothetical protein
MWNICGIRSEYACQRLNIPVARARDVWSELHVTNIVCTAMHNRPSTFLNSRDPPRDNTVDITRLLRIGRDSAKRRASVSIAPCARPRPSTFGTTCTYLVNLPINFTT